MAFICQLDDYPKMAAATTKKEQMMVCSKSISHGEQNPKAAAAAAAATATATVTVTIKRKQAVTSEIYTYMHFV